MSITKQQNTDATANNTIKPRATNQTTLKQKIADKPLTRKQQAFVDVLLSDKKISATQAAMETYNAKDRMVARNIASENMAKPGIQSKLAMHSDMVESALVNTVKDWGGSDKPREREIALDSAKFIHDKVHGKATQRVEQTTTGVSLVINLTGNDQPQQ